MNFDVRSILSLVRKSVGSANADRFPKPYFTHAGRLIAAGSACSSSKEGRVANDGIHRLIGVCRSPRTPELGPWKVERGGIRMGPCRPVNKHEPALRRAMRSDPAKVRPPVNTRASLNNPARPATLGAKRLDDGWAPGRGHCGYWRAPPQSPRGNRSEAGRDGSPAVIMMGSHGACNGVQAIPGGDTPRRRQQGAV